MKRLLPILLASVACAHGETYLLKLDRPAKVGDKAEISLTHMVQRSLKLSERDKLMDEYISLRRGTLEAVSEVLAVDAKYRATKVLFKVKSFRFSADKDKEPAEVAGGIKEIIAEFKGGAALYRVDGGVPSAEVKGILSDLFYLNEGSRLDDMAYLRLDVMRKEGEEWELDKEAVYKWMPEDLPYEYDRSATVAKAKFDGVEVVDGVRCGAVDCNILFKITNGKGFNDRGKFLDGGGSVKFHEVVPVDPENTTHFDKEAVIEARVLGEKFATPGSPTTQLEVVQVHRTRSKSRPVK